MARGPGKGKSNNPAGRPKGIKDKRVQAWESIGEYLVGKGAERALEIMQRSSDAEFMAQFEKLLQYFRPKLKQVDETANHDVTIRIVDESDAGNND